MNSDELRVSLNAHEDPCKIIDTKQLRLFVGTWNVGGRAPRRETRESVQAWLDPEQLAPADIYVMGFQEIVPLNAQNVLGKNMTDRCDAAQSASYKWEALIFSTLNRSSSGSGSVATGVGIPSMATAPILHKDANSNEGDVALNARAITGDVKHAKSDEHEDGTIVTPCNRLYYDDNRHINDDAIQKYDVDKVAANLLDECSRNENNAHVNNFDSGKGASDFCQSHAKFDLVQGCSNNHTNGPYPEQHFKFGSFVKHIQILSAEHIRRCTKYSTPHAYRGIVPCADVIGPHGCSGTSADTCNMYTGIARKRMVGLFISVWVRSSLQHYVKGVKVSSVGCGIFNRLGNKGSVSVSLFILDTSFCFICTHLRSGDKPGDASRRNVDVNNILQRTIFSCSGKSQCERIISLPETILAHDRIVWLGDLNYRLTLPPDEVQGFLALGDWRTLIESDELKNEKLVGGVFEGWHEGAICFAPTYKYKINTDTFSMMVDAKQGSKRRSPAWCDRILWYGKGIKQLSYSRCELKHSDHRPVRSYFLVEVESMAAQLTPQIKALDPF